MSASQYAAADAPASYGASAAVVPVDMIVREVLVDARCLQDLRFRHRGIGQHAMALLEGTPQTDSDGRRLKLIAGIDRRLPSLEDGHRTLFAEERPLHSQIGLNGLVIQLSPMTHSPQPLMRTLMRADVEAVAIIYDFIPLDLPTRYLADASARAEYLACLATLNDYDRFVSISRFSADRLEEILGVEPQRSHVSGVAVRESVIDAYQSASVGGDLYCLAVLGDDTRKNPEVVIKAHARSGMLRDRMVALKIVGHYAEASRDRLRDLYMREGGQGDRLQFHDHLTDQELSALYSAALVTVCPSRAEGFSIPVVGANANGCPVIAADCAAQVELMGLPEYQFDPDDWQAVQRLMEQFLNPAAGQKARVRQGDFWRRFAPTEVQKRFWDGTLGQAVTSAVSETTIENAPYVHRTLKPKIAIASPVPPDRSGVADYTAVTMQALSRYAVLDLFTQTKDPRPSQAFSSVQLLSAEPYQDENRDAVLSVLGNSHLSYEIFNLLLDFGGAAIAHDARMVDFYVALLGHERTLDVARREAKRNVAWPEVESWLANPRKMPILFLSDVLEAASTTFVHSPTTKRIIKSLYERDVTSLPFAVYRQMHPESVGPAGRDRARRIIDVGANDRVVISLGDIVQSKAVEECIWTMSMLAEWQMPTTLALVGRCDEGYARHLEMLAANAGVADKVRIIGQAVDERTYQAYLAGADAAIQFRNYGFGGLSGALLDEIAAGLPVVANAHLAEAMVSPSYVHRVSDGLSPVLTAEALLAIFDGPDRNAHEEERQVFLAEHSPDVYEVSLMKGLGFDPTGFSV